MKKLFSAGLILLMSISSLAGGSPVFREEIELPAADESIMSPYVKAAACSFLSFYADVGDDPTKFIQDVDILRDARNGKFYPASFTRISIDYNYCFKHMKGTIDSHTNLYFSHDLLEAGINVSRSLEFTNDKLICQLTRDKMGDLRGDYWEIDRISDYGPICRYRSLNKGN